MLIASLFPEPVELPGVLLKEIRWGQITASSKPCVRAYLVTYSVKALAKVQDCYVVMIKHRFTSQVSLIACHTSLWSIGKN